MVFVIRSYLYISFVFVVEGYKLRLQKTTINFLPMTFLHICNLINFLWYLDFILNVLSFMHNGYLIFQVNYMIILSSKILTI